MLEANQLYSATWEGESTVERAVAPNNQPYIVGAKNVQPKNNACSSNLGVIAKTRYAFLCNCITTKSQKEKL